VRVRALLLRHVSGTVTFLDIGIKVLSIKHIWPNLLDVHSWDFWLFLYDLPFVMLQAFLCDFCFSATLAPFLHTLLNET
jgi:hypothetical protein